MVVNSVGFLEMSRELLVELLARDTLTIPEVELFEAALHWVKAECQRESDGTIGATEIRAALGVEALRAIRFPIINSKEFTMRVGRS